MNKQLINKYKPEFDHWLNEGKILYKHINSNAWWNDEPWNYSPDYVTAIIINDEYSEFRKALAEGKVIQINNSNPETWIDIDTDKLANYNPSFLRIKPDEPKFKVGDFVRYIHSTLARALEINNINGNRYYFTNSEMSCLKHELEPWTPVKGEWCWFYDDLDSKYSHLAQFYDMNISEDNSLSTFMSSPITKWYYCEPFLNSIPSYLKDK